MTANQQLEQAQEQRYWQIRKKQDKQTDKQCVNETNKQKNIYIENIYYNTTAILWYKKTTSKVKTAEIKDVSNTYIDIFYIIIFFD